jgi:3-phosphoshikimate 1-carboxyvinyltransferase
VSRISLPGDKSLTHRALLLGSLATGESHIRNPLTGEDCRSTAAALRALGVRVPALPAGSGSVRITGMGLRGLASPEGDLDVGNSGTTARLLLGILSGQPNVVARLTGDASLRSRPMRRVTFPLEKMGARFVELGEPDRLPIEVRGGALQTLDYPSPVASAQVKSAILLAGLTGSVPVAVLEPRRSRDHTERLLAAMGAPTVGHRVQGGWRVELRDPPDSLLPLDFAVPADFSSAAFILALGILGGAGEGIEIPGVCLNPTRTGLLRVLERMGVGDGLEVIQDSDAGSPGGSGTAVEPVGALTVRPVSLRGCEVGASEIPDLIDEIPILAVLAARAEGETVLTGAAELRVKESDRLSALAGNLGALGVAVEELPDGLVVQGTDRPLRGRVRCFGDHRIAMAFGILGALPGNAIEVEEPELAEVSFPGFWDEIRRLSKTGSVAGSQRLPGSPPTPARLPSTPGIVVTIDGPAGSGKSTTARAVAERLGYRHLDSGAIYRALTLSLLEMEIPSEEWADLDADVLAAIPVAVSPRGRSLRITLGDRALGDELRGPEVTSAVSIAARVPAVRARLLDLQREAGKAGRLVADGRDMGSVVFPDAELKVFLVADLEERARRRLLQQGEVDPGSESVREEAERIRHRDALDSSREASPLVRPAGALELDTTNLSFDEQVDAIVHRVKELTTS